jgi:hypothetical protein
VGADADYLVDTTIEAHQRIHQAQPVRPVCHSAAAKRSAIGVLPPKTLESDSWRRQGVDAQRLVLAEGRPHRGGTVDRPAAWAAYR